jgi:hypothetical protein
MQVNEAQLAAERPVGGATRFTFKPSIAPSMETPSLSFAHKHTPGTATTQPLLTAGSAIVTVA